MEMCAHNYYYEDDEEEGGACGSVLRGRTVALLFAQRIRTHSLSPQQPRSLEMPTAGNRRGKQLLTSRAVQGVGRRVCQLQILFHHPVPPAPRALVLSVKRAALHSVLRVYWVAGRPESVCFFVTMKGGRHFYLITMVCLYV